MTVTQTARPRAVRHRKRLAHWLSLSVLTAGVTALGLGTGARTWTQVSLVFAYLGLGGMLATLAIGPLQRLTGRPRPTNSYLRRDIGIWSALVSTGHVVVVLGPHRVFPLARYFTDAGPNPLLHPRTDQFGQANLLGLLALVLALGLVSISNDRALRRLGKRWKQYQRANYAIAIAASTHTMNFWSLMERDGILVGVASVAMTALLLLRLAAWLQGTAPHR